MLKQNQEKSIPDDFYNHFHSIFRHFDVFPNYPFATSETMCDYYYKHGIYQLPHELANDLKLKMLHFRHWGCSAHTRKKRLRMLGNQEISLRKNQETV